ncbi:hypothetical protein J8L88_22000 [Aquimarina sp. MMG015]|uniref:hypothetical protein n=1 Tax=Aquimarina sp. MMG015 TaxID=2822689 RepID=UPI001B3A387E|nr:hypothetical protein [Aquimarina sp. MMG015]MBQ4805552.1 hypothetical protein [Aquimarina sp. MMG015]
MPNNLYIAYAAFGRQTQHTRDVGNNMKRRTRIIIGIVVIGILTLSSFYFLPSESSLYLKSDMTYFKKSIMPISIILSIVIAVLVIFDRTEYNGKKWWKIMYIIYIGIMCYLIYPMMSDTVLMLGLKTNRLSSNELIIKKFIVTIKDSYDNLDNTVWGRVPNKMYDGEIDKLKLTQKEYDLVNEKQEIILEMEKGIFGIPFNPIIKK